MPSLLADNFNGSAEPFMLKHTPTSISCLAVFSLTFLLGLPGNGLVIWVITLKMKRTVNTIWFLNLAVADFLCCLSLPFYIVHLALFEHWPYGWFFCKIIPTTIIFNMFASVFLLTIISIDRCLVVMKPVWCQNHRTVRFTSKICSGIWLLAFIMCCPAFFFREISMDEFGNTICIYSWYEEYAEDNWLVDLFSSNDVPFTPYPTFMVNGTYENNFTDGILDMYLKYHILNTTEKSKRLHSSIANSHGTNKAIDLSMTVINHPTPILHTFPRTQWNIDLSNILHSDVPPDSYYSVSNHSIKMYLDELSESQPPNALVSITVTRSVVGFLLPFGIMVTCYVLIAHKMLKHQFAKSCRKTLRVILLVIGTFFLCWAPYHVIGVLYLLATPSTAFYEMLVSWDHISTALAYANSCINPLVYVFVGGKFREKARQTVQRIFEEAFSEEGTCSTAYSRDRNKTSVVKDIDVSVL